MLPWVGRWNLSWKKQRRLQGKTKNYSLIKKLRLENKSNDDFEVMKNDFLIIGGIAKTQNEAMSFIDNLTKEERAND